MIGLTFINNAHETPQPLSFKFFYLIFIVLQILKPLHAKITLKPITLDHNFVHLHVSLTLK